MLTNTIPSYLYEQYQDDDDLIAFVQAYNELAQEFLDTINGLNLPNYTQAPVSDLLLDWVGAGLYGYPRPVLPTTSSIAIGPVNTFLLNQIPVNGYNPAATQTFYTTDDLYRRCLTWHLFKGDGKVFTVEWLKRRIMRFLFGANGINFNVDETYRISVQFGPDGEVFIVIVNATRTITSGPFNTFVLNSIPVNGETSFTTTYDTIPAASLLELAFAAGILETPFQYSFTVTQGTLAEYAI